MRKWEVGKIKIISHDAMSIIYFKNFCFLIEYPGKEINFSEILTETSIFYIKNEGKIFSINSEKLNSKEFFTFQFANYEFGWKGENPSTEILSNIIKTYANDGLEINFNLNLDKEIKIKSFYFIIPFENLKFCHINFDQAFQRKNKIFIFPGKEGYFNINDLIFIKELKSDNFSINEDRIIINKKGCEVILNKHFFKLLQEKGIENLGNLLFDLKT